MSERSRTSGAKAVKRRTRACDVDLSAGAVPTGGKAGCQLGFTACLFGAMAIAESAPLLAGSPDACRAPEGLYKRLQSWRRQALRRAQPVGGGLLACLVLARRCCRRQGFPGWGYACWPTAPNRRKAAQDGVVPLELRSLSPMMRVAAPTLRVSCLRGHGGVWRRGRGGGCLVSLARRELWAARGLQVLVPGGEGRPRSWADVACWSVLLRECCEN